jgi:6-phosphogluconolactonase
MKYGSRILGAYLSAVLLAGCGGNNGFALPNFLSQSTFDSPPSSLMSATPGYRQLYKFRGDQDGAGPEGELVAVDGMLYGTTSAGGRSRGTAFKVTPDGVEKVVHVFYGKANDGAIPHAGFTVVTSIVGQHRVVQLWGTSAAGGTKNDGTAFSMTLDGAVRVLHSFTGGTDGKEPISALSTTNGAPVGLTDTVRYGTTYTADGCTTGGRPICNVATVFSVAGSGAEKTLHVFTSSAGPFHTFGQLRHTYGALTYVNGTYYGTAANGGNGYCSSGRNSSCVSIGGVFTIKPSGQFHDLYHFEIPGSVGPRDGAQPLAGLINAGGALYGTTSSDVERDTRNGVVSGHGGVVFKISTDGKEAVLFHFHGGNGREPRAVMTDVNGTLYGTTERGGAHHCGTIFSITTDGVEAVLYNFACGSDGAYPRGGLLYLNGMLYGTTFSGGNGYGTVYSLVPPPATAPTASPAPAGRQPVGIAALALKKFAYVANSGSGNVSGYAIDAGGSLNELKGSPFAAGANPNAIAVDTSNDSLLYVANRDSNDVSAYRVGSDGALQALAGSPFPAGRNPSGVAYQREGHFVYVSNSGDNTVSAYTSRGGLMAVKGSPFKTGTYPTGVAVYRPHNFVYVSNAGSENISAYTVDRLSGALTEVTGSPFKAGHPEAVTVTRNFLYAANRNGSVSAYTINTNSGALIEVKGSPFAAGRYPRAVAADNNGRFVYVANSESNSVSAYAIDASTGALTEIKGSPFATGPDPRGVVIPILGKVAYVTNGNSNNVSMYAVEADGSLTPLPRSP